MRRRRNPLRSSFFLRFIVGFLFVSSAVAQKRSAGSTLNLKEATRTDRAPRQVLPLNANWKFNRQSTPGAAVEAAFVGAEKPGYDDTSWTMVHLPHTWEASADNPFVVTGHFRGLGWYRREFRVPAEREGQRVYVQFNGVFQTADVWVNGRPIGRHVGGFTGFLVDATDSVKWNAANLLAVRVNDVLDPFVAPASESNVPAYGGIYRSVSLVVTSPLHFPANPLRIAWSVAEKNTVKLDVTTRVENSTSVRRSVRLETLVANAPGQPAIRLSNSVVVEAGQIAEIHETATLASPHLWSVDDPYLYNVESTLEEGGRAVDRVATRIGIRFMGYDPASGFTLNGRSINLHGVDRRQDYGFLGDAVPEAVGVKDIRMIKVMGGNFIRTAHYPQDPAVLDECDRVGILVWEEIPNIKIHMYPPAMESINTMYTERFPRPLMENLKQQLREMIERDCNRPSIIIWGLADDLSTYRYPEDFVELVSHAHELDPTRWTAGRTPHVTDVIDATSEPGLVEQHRLHPERKYIWNEWGSFASERGLEGRPYYKSLPADPLADVSMADSEAALLMEGYLMQWTSLPWLGTAKWCMFDTGEINAERTRPLWDQPYPDGRVTFRWPFDDYLGVDDMWRLPKEGFYLLQSQWTEKAMIHIVGDWTSGGPGGAQIQKRDVRVYSNADTVELMLNGKTLGVRRPEEPEEEWQGFEEDISRYRTPDEFNQKRLPGAALKHPPFVWRDVPYEAGRLVAVGRKGDVTVQDEIRTPGAPVRIRLRTDRTTLADDDADVSFIEADVVDANGVVVTTARPWIRFSSQGPGRLLGGTTEIDAINGVAAINVQNNGESGEIVVTATSPGLEAGSVRIMTK